MQLLPPELLVKTGPVDEALWNYSPWLGFLQRRRFHLALRLIKNRCFNNLLEVGYGSGIFMPTLARHCKNLSGVDIHGSVEVIRQTLEKSGFRADLRQSSATALPFEDNTFDGIVAISALEFVEPAEEMATELARVCQPDGSLIVVSPAQSWWLDQALRLTTGSQAELIYQQRRTELLPRLLQRFTLTNSVSFPAIVSRVGGAIYHGWELTPATQKNVN